MTGSFEFLVTLPVSGATLAASRLASLVVFQLFGSLAFVLGTGSYMSHMPGLDLAGFGISAMVPFYLATLFLVISVAWTTAGVTVAFSLNNATRILGLSAFAVFYGGDRLLNLLIDDPGRLAADMLSHDLAPLIAVAVSLAVAVPTCTAAFFLTKRGFDRFELKRDAVD